MSPLLPWLSLAIALSPAWLELGTHLVRAPEARYVVLAPLLLAWAWRRAPEPAPPRRDGLLLLAAAVALELLALSSGTEPLARLALPVGFVGMARFGGAPTLPIAALSLWIVPLPHTLVQFFTPTLESELLAIAALLPRAAGAPLLLDGPRIDTAGGWLQLVPTDGGLALAWAMALLGWFDGLRAGRGLAGCLLRACAWAALGVPVQALALLLAVVTTLAGAPGLARAGLTHGVWPLAFLIATLRWTRRSDSDV